MKLLVDTNVILDVLLNRLPWVNDAKEIWLACDQGNAVGYVPASALTDIFYIARRATDLTKAHQAVRVCLDAFIICPVDRQTLEYAYSLPGNDFEDNLQVACAILAELDYILTRDPAGVASSPLPALSPSEWLNLYRGDLDSSE